MRENEADLREVMKDPTWLAKHVSSLWRQKLLSRYSRDYRMSRKCFENVTSLLRRAMQIPAGSPVSLKVWLPQYFNLCLAKDSSSKWTPLPADYINNTNRHWYRWTLWQSKGEVIKDCAIYFDIWLTKNDQTVRKWVVLDFVSCSFFWKFPAIAEL